MNCRQCQKELINTPGKRSKSFCNPTCRSKYWKKKQPKKASKLKWKIELSGQDISDKCMVDLKNGVVTIPGELVGGIVETVDPSNKGETITITKPMTFQEILDLAKGGGSRQEVEAAIAQKGNLTPGQQDVIRRKIFIQ